MASVPFSTLRSALQEMERMFENGWSGDKNRASASSLHCGAMHEELSDSKGPPLRRREQQVLRLLSGCKRKLYQKNEGVNRRIFHVYARTDETYKVSTTAQSLVFNGDCDNGRMINLSSDICGCTAHKGLPSNVVKR